MKVYKITLCFVDHDQLGDDQTGQLFNNLHLPNHICKPSVEGLESADIGEWEDSNPLNFQNRRGAEFRRLFPDESVPMLLHCPQCSARHVDEGEFATKPHHTHACQSCGHVWRPAIGPTCGVQFLPGFKNEEK